MSKDQYFKLTLGGIAYPVFFILIIWSVMSFEIQFNVNFNEYGVYPRTLKGLRGVIFSPFIHGSMEHLYHNTAPLFVLSMALFYFYRPIAWKVLLYGVLLSGFLTWCIGRSSYHVGASGLIYVLVSFIFFKGIWARHFRLIALSLLVVFLYGSMVWYVMPIKDGMSWEGHLAGLVTGLIFALLFRNKIIKPKKYDWQKDTYNEDNDPFLRHFDEKGNFIENIDQEEETTENLDVNYIYKENKD